MDTLFNGRYRLLRVLGSGGMGTVYLAESISLGKLWAIKQIPKKGAGNFDLLAEPNILKKLNHPALPSIIDIEYDDDNIYIVEDYIDGISLDKQLKTQNSFEEQTVINWAKQLCEILTYLHSQSPPIIYRDMKPSNIIINPDGKVKVIDFGIAREYKSSSQSDTSYVGTRGYAAPEQYGTSQTDARTDIYSLGVTLYHMLTGKSPNDPPYELLPLRSVNPRLSEGIEYIIGKCVQSNPANRYQSTSELMRDLNNIKTFNKEYKKAVAAYKVKTVFKGTFIIISLALIFFGIRNISAGRTEEYNNLMDSGQTALDAYDFDSAQNYFNEASKLKSSSPEPYLSYAQLLIKKGNYDECISYLTNIAGSMHSLPNNAMYMYLMGSAYFENGDYSNAGGYLQRATELDPSEVTYARDTAVCFAKLGDYNKAQEFLNSITGRGDDALVYYINGQISDAKNEYNSALSYYDQTIESSSDEELTKKAFISKSDIYKKLRSSDPSALSKQIQTLETALSTIDNKDDIILTEQLAEAYFSDNNYNASIEKFRKLLDMGYDRAYIYRNIAIIYQQMNDLSSAENILLDMQEKYPDNYQCYLQLAYVYMESEGNKPESSRNYSTVLENYNKAVQFAPDGANTSDIIPLTSKINELRQKGWL